MLHLQNTRASRRALAAASAHSAVRARRPLLVLSTVTAALIGVSLAAGLVVAPAVAAEGPDNSTEPVPVSSVVLSTVVDATVSRDVDAANLAADDALEAANALTTEAAASGLDLGDTAPTVDTAQLQSAVDALSTHDDSGVEAVMLTLVVEERTTAVAADTAALQQALAAAQEKKAADDAAAAEAAAAQAAAEAAALAASNTVEGAQQSARVQAAADYGWGDDQFACLVSLWNKESGWNYQAYNPSGATGIPQALPGSKMASAGSDWQTNAATQIAWGLAYISSVYGTPCSAWGHSQSVNWY